MVAIAGREISTGSKCVKALLFLFNFLFFLAGLALIVLGALVATHFKKYLQGSSGTGVIALAIFLIVVGAVIFVIGFFGCCGAIKESYCMLMTFALMLGLILILEIAAGVTAFVMRGKVNEALKDELDKSIIQYDPAKDQSQIVRMWNVMQGDFECCGNGGYADWKQNPNYSSGVPDSCCKVELENCGKNKGWDSDANLNKDGCYGKVKGFIKDNIHYIGGAGIGLAFIELVGIAMACCLAKSIKDQYEQVA